MANTRYGLAPKVEDIRECWRIQPTNKTWTTCYGTWGTRPIWAL